MSQNLRTTIITANYNNGKYFKEYLYGIVSQSVKPNNVVIVDDCSTDNSIELINNGLLDYNAKLVLKSYDGRLFHYNLNDISILIYQADKNSGPARARNTAIKNSFSLSDIFFIYDSDDVYYPNKIERSLDIFKKYPEIGLVYSDYDTYNEETKELKKEFKEPFSYRRLVQECIVSNNSAIKASILNKSGLYDETLYGPEDYDLWLRLSEVSAAYHIPESLYKYRITGNNLTIKTPKPKFAEHVRRVHIKRLQRQGVNING